MNEMTLFNTLFDNALAHSMPALSFPASARVPSVDVKQTKEAYTLEMDLPGKTENDVKIELDRNLLTISSQKEETSEKTEADSGKKNEGGAEYRWLIRERHASSFSRQFTLPDDVDSSAVAANFKNGVLFVVMPRKAQKAPKTIAITAS